MGDALDIVLPYQWSPRPWQVPNWNYYKDGGKRAVKNWHRRSGKDEVDLRHMSCAMRERRGTYWYMLPEYAQARKAMWDAIDEEQGQRRIDLIFPPCIRTLYREQEMLLGYAGSTFQLVGADNFHNLVGSPPVGLIFSEYSRTKPQAWGYLMPIIEKNGGWVGFNSTPFGDNHFKALADYARKTPGWFYEEITADQTTVYTKAQLIAIKSQLIEEYGESEGTALFMQEYYCSFDAAIGGSVFAEWIDRAQLAGRICDYPIVGGVINTAWDLGYEDDTAIGFYQITTDQIDVFDHHASHHKDADFYIELLLAKLKEYPGCRYGTHYVPHDARPRTLAAGGKSILQQFLDAADKHPELGRFQIVSRLDRQEGIQAARKTLGYCRFHATRCRKLLKSLRHYHRVWDGDLMKYSHEPVHDWSSHDADMFRYLSLSWKFTKESAPDSPLVDKLLAGSVQQQTFGALKQRHFDRKRQIREWAS